MPPQTLSVGDIAVCRTAEYLFGHRVIAVGERDGRAYVVTRPDRSRAGGDRPTFDDDLLGVVVGVERNGVPVPLRPAAQNWVVRQYLGARLACAEAQPRARRRLGAAVAFAQGRPLYARAARRCFALTRPRLSFRVRVPLNATLGDAVWRSLPAGRFDPTETWRGRPVDAWTLTLHVNGEREPGVWARIARSGAREWRADELRTRVRYRGLGLEALLLRRAEAIVARSGERVVSSGIR